MIFKITKNDDFFDVNPPAELIEEFENISSRDMKYIALVYDYDSPLKNLPVSERSEKALEFLKFDRNKNGDWSASAYDLKHMAKDKYIFAVKKYKELLCDIDKNTLIAYKKQMEDFNDFLRKKGKDSSELRTALSIVKDADKLRQMIKDFEEKISIRDNKDLSSLDSVDEGSSLSLIESINEEEFE